VIALFVAEWGANVVASEIRQYSLEKYLAIEIAAT
jgi:hypothetical protein